MLQAILIGAFISGVAVIMFIKEFKNYHTERNDINLAKNISEHNNSVGNIIAIEKLTHGTNLNSDFTNSELMNIKPLTFKISEIQGGDRERDIINKYEQAVKKVFETDPNSEPDCTLIASTNILSQEECEEVHLKSYNFFHKTEDGLLAYKIENENVKKYAQQIETNKYNINKKDFKEEDKVFLDTRYLEVNSPFLSKQSLLKKEETIKEVKKEIENEDFLLASSNLYNLKKGDYKDDKNLASLYSKLIEDIEIFTKDAQKGSEQYDLRLKIQSEFLKLTRNSNIMESLKVYESENLKNFINSIDANFDEIKESEENLSQSSLSELPSKEFFLEKTLMFNN